MAEEQSRLELLQQQCALAQKEVDSLAPEAERLKARIDAAHERLADKQVRADEVQAELDKKLKEHKAFVAQTLRSQGSILAGREAELKGLGAQAAAAKVKEQAAKVSEEEALRLVAECRAASDADVTSMEEAAKRAEAKAKDEVVKAAERVASLEKGAVEKLEKLVENIEQARKDLDTQLGAAGDTEKKCAEAAVIEGGKRQKAIQEKREQLVEMEEQRAEVTPQVAKVSADRRELEEEYVQLCKRYDAVAAEGNGEEKKLLEEGWALQARLDSVGGASPEAAALEARVKGLEQQLQDARLKHDIADAGCRARTGEGEGEAAAKAAEAAARVADARQSVAQSRAKFSEKLEKAGKEHATLRAQLSAAKRAREAAEGSVAEQSAAVNKARAQVMVKEAEATPAPEAASSPKTSPPKKPKRK